MDSKTWDSLNCLLCSSIKYSKELSSFWKQVSALTLKSSPLVCHKKSSRNKTDKGKILDSPGQQTALPNHFTFGLCQILRFWFRNFQKTEEIPKMCCVSTPLFFPPMKQIGISSSSSPLLIHFRSTNAGLFFGNGWETRKSDQFVDKSGKAPFTQDAEVLANAACKKWNTLFPIGVFTQHCKQHQRICVQICVQTCLRVLCELGLCWTDGAKCIWFNLESRPWERSQQISCLALRCLLTAPSRFSATYFLTSNWEDTNATSHIPRKLNTLWSTRPKKAKLCMRKTSRTIFFSYDI